VIGAGTYADDAACAVSATGAGEPLLRAVLGHEVASLVRHGGLSLAEACHRALEERVGRLDGRGGLIAVDTRGSIAMPFTTEVMFRAWRLGARPPEAAIR
jgi:beta-aspartyl-peptidase (threonine type)